MAKKPALLVFAALFCMPFLAAQTGSTSALTGTVKDSTGAVVPNVAVTATNTGTNRSRTVNTGTDGVYSIPLLDPGPYRVTFAAAGFKTGEVTSITLTVTETTSLDHSLQVGSQSEQVTVEANVETIQTATSTLGTTVTGSRITALPLATRNFTQVLGMSTGVAGDVANGAGFGRGSQNMSVNGAAPEKNNYQMDGVEINNAAGNNNAGDAGLYTGIATPNPDAIQEFKIQTSTYDASFGRNPGANVNVVTKSGTNTVARVALRVLPQRSPQRQRLFLQPRQPATARTQKQVLKQNQFGGTIGGPIKKGQAVLLRQLSGNPAAEWRSRARLRLGHVVPDSWQS